MSEYTWLIDGYCELVNKTFLFIENNFEGVVPAGRPDEDIYRRSKELYDRLNLISEAGEYEVAIQRAGIQEAEAGGVDTIAVAHAQQGFFEHLGAYLEFATEYFEQGNPWNALEQDRKVCRNTVLNTVQMIANLTVCLAVLNEPCVCQVKNLLGLEDAWRVQAVHSGYCIKSFRMV